MSFIGGGVSFGGTFPIRFINLNVSDLLSIFEGRSLYASKLFMKSENPIILFSSSILSRFPRFDVFVSRFLQFYSNVRILNISSSCNEKGSLYFNFDTLNRGRLLIKSENFFLQLSENIFLKKLVHSLNKNFLWFNSHGSRCASGAKLIVPLKTSFEYEDTYLNFEQRPQKSNVVNDNVSDALDLGTFFNSLSGSSPFVYKHESFLQELVLSKNKFEKLKDHKSLVSYITSKDSFFNSTSVSKYPLKSSFENFYLTSNSTKNSRLMQKCSQNLFSKKSLG
jgi:NADH dehydrogenase/NADH:ubiquinone oxidoreductase subunit G